MGTWGPGIFDDDVSADVQIRFEEALEESGDPIHAAKEVLSDMEDELEDDDDAPIIYFALAALQLKHGQMSPSIKKKALAHIKSGYDLARWEDGSSESVERKKNLEKRKEVLEALKLDLLKK